MKYSKKKILIADSHHIFRERLKNLISESPDMIVAAEAANRQEVLAVLRRNNIDMVILDMEISDNSGLDILKEIKREKPDLGIVILSIFPAEQYAACVLNAGACCYLTKENISDELLHALQWASHGEKYFSSSSAEEFWSVTSQLA